MCNKIIIVEDEQHLAKLYKRMLNKAGYETKISSNSSEFFGLYFEFKPDLILLDIRLKNSELTGLEIFEKLVNEEKLKSSVIVLSGEATRTEIAQSMKLGAITFIEKKGDFNSQKFLTDVRQAINLKIQEDKNRQLTDENKNLRNRLSELHPFIGKSEKILKLKKIAKKFAQAEADVLLIGETGTGKEVLANYIAQNSPRIGKPFINVNAGGISETLIDSELFGHKRGSFTGAITDKKGFFEQANKGILFLDEISNLSLSGQAKILRAIEYKEIKILGGGSKKTDVMLIFATNIEPIQLINEGKFREDLFYRLEGNTIKIPPLRDRGDDILILMEYFFNKYCRKYNCRNFSDLNQLKKLLKSYHWPGNVRELQKFCEYIVILHDEITNELVEEELNLKFNNNFQYKNLEKLLKISGYNEAMNSFDLKYLKYQISLRNGNVNLTAKEIGLDKSTIYKKLKKNDS